MSSTKAKRIRLKVDEEKNREIVNNFLKEELYLNWYKAYTSQSRAILTWLGVSYKDLYHDALFRFQNTYDGSTQPNTYFGCILRVMLHETLRIRSKTKQGLAVQKLIGINYDIKDFKEKLAVNLDPTNYIVEVEQTVKFRKALKESSKLSDRERTVLTMTIEEVPIVEIAEKFQVTEPRIHQLRHSAIKKLRSELLEV